MYFMDLTRSYELADTRAAGSSGNSTAIAEFELDLKELVFVAVGTDATTLVVPFPRVITSYSHAYCP